MYPTIQTYTKSEVDTIASNNAYYWGNPIGTLISFYGNTAPAHYWQCAGQWYDRNLYPTLFNILQSDYLPDFRECAIVGIGQNYRTSQQGLAEHDIYTLGEFKDDCLQSHTHVIQQNPVSSGKYLFAKAFFEQAGSTHVYGTYGFSDNPFLCNPWTGRFGNITRGKRMGALICIRYE